MDCPELNINEERLKAHLSLELTPYPADKCSVCGGAHNIEAHRIPIHAARKTAIIPGPAGLTHAVEYKKGVIVAYLCEECRKRGHGISEKIEFSVALLLLTAVVVWGINVGMGVFSLILILPAGGLLGFLFVIFNKLFKITTPINDEDIPGIRKLLDQISWSLGEKPDRSSIMITPEHWPWEQCEIDRKKKSERQQLMKQLKPETILDKICLVAIVVMIIFVLAITCYLVWF